MRRKKASDHQLRKAIAAAIACWNREYELAEGPKKNKERWFIHSVQIKLHELYDHYGSQEGPSSGVTASGRRIIKTIEENGLYLEDEWVSENGKFKDGIQDIVRKLALD